MTTKPISELGRPLAEGDIVRFIRNGKMGYQNRRELQPDTYRKLYVVITPAISSPGTIYDGRIGVAEDANAIVEHAYPRETMEYVEGHVATQYGIFPNGTAERLVKRNAKTAAWVKKRNEFIDFMKGCGHES